MQRTVAAIVLTLFVAAVAFFAGGKLGYRFGISDATGFVAPSEAAYTTAVLEQINVGETAMAKRLLETELDSYLVARWAYEGRDGFVATAFRSGDNDSRQVLMNAAATYRRNHPHPISSATASAAVMDVTTKYAQPNKASPNNSIDR